jgi:hypothetical protein
MRRAIRAAPAIAHDKRIPRWLRVLIIIGILPVVGPVGPLALVVGIVLLVALYRPIMVEHYRIQGLEALMPIDTWGGWC